MDTKRYTPELVVRENLEFSIPLYQRLFTWGEEQVRGLLNDLRDHFEKDHSKKCKTPYYLGMLSCIKKDGRYELIDGQQRFTVMMLMGIVLKKYLPGRWGTFLAKGKRVHFVARSKDRDYLESRSMSSVDEEPSLSQSNARMEEAIRVIERFMSEFQDEEQKKCFAQNVFKRMSFFFSELPPEYMDTPASLNKYFEAMNAHGKSLEQHEILKVDLMRDEPDKEFLTRIWNAVSEMDTPIIKKAEDQKKEDYRKMYEDAIELCRKKQYQEAFSKCTASNDAEDDETIGSIQAEEPKHTSDAAPQKSEKKSLLTFPLFLRLVLDIHRSLDATYSYYRKDLISIFKDKDYRPSDIKSFYHDLLFYRLLYDFCFITMEEGAEGNRYSLVYGDGQEEKTHRDKDRVIQYQSMLYVSQTPIYKWIKPLLVRLRDHSPTDMHELLTWLKEIDDEGRKLPGEDELSYDNVDRYWFWRLDYYLWEKAETYFEEKTDQEIVNEYVFRSNRSIEHLHPRHQEHNSQWEDAHIHSFGNLAMISQSFNSEQSDDPVTVKFARIQNQAANHSLQSLKLYKMYLDAEKVPGGWTVQVKDKHQEEMYRLLEESFTREKDLP